jgi:hypothetical protein
MLCNQIVLKYRNKVILHTTPKIERKQKTENREYIINIESQTPPN